MGACYSGGMDYLDFALIKLGLFGLAAFVWGIFCGLNGRNLRWEPLEGQDAEARDSSER